jgi:hypothetical protein
MLDHVSSQGHVQHKRKKGHVVSHDHMLSHGHVWVVNIVCHGIPSLGSLHLQRSSSRWLGRVRVASVKLFYKVGSMLHTRGGYPLVFRVGVVFPLDKIPDASLIGGKLRVNNCFDFVVVGFAFHNFWRWSCVVGAVF